MQDAVQDNLVADLAWDVVARRLAAGASAILPIGAAAKEHGFHLPMATDQIQAEWLAARIADHIDALIWPTVTYGHYPAFVRYAGSLSLSAPVFEALVTELVEGLVSFGARAIFILDTGISTIAPLARVVGGFRQREPVHHLKIHDGPRYRAAAQRLAEQTHGSHADELETSRMLALAPGLVDMARAEASPLRASTPGPLTPTDVASPNYSRSGSYGDPRLASRAKGDVLLAAMVDDLVEAAQGAVAANQRRTGS